MSIDVKRRIAAAGFVALLALSIFWPMPVLTVNDVCCHARLPIDDLSFLGREAPSYDVAFWCIAGLFAIALLQSAESLRFTLPRPARPPARAWAIAAVAFAASAALVALTWRYLDAPVTAYAERIASDNVQDVIRLFNRFGGGMNPAMVVAFFLLAGVAYRTPRWIDYAVAMTLAGAAAGLLAQAVKYAVGRTRPELWLGPFQHARASATSFPSGHTVGAFALGGVLFFASRNTALRVAALLLAIAVGVSRILAFRHWTSDVVASAAIGAIAAFIATAATPSRESAPVSPAAR